MKYYLLLIVSLHFVDVHAQSKQDYIWLFGQDMETSAYNGYIFDFNAPPMEVLEHDNNIGIGSGNASICDEEGNLLMYMNGCAVMGSNFEMMPNGDSLSYNILWDFANFDCRLGIGSFQDHLILDDPSNANKFYIIHKPFIYNGNGLIDSIPMWYSTVDLSLNNDLGDVTKKNIVLDNNRIFLVSYLTAIRHHNSEDWWILQPPIDDSLFHVYLIDDEGIKLDHIENSGYYMTRFRTSASGTSKFSPDGSKFAWYNYFDQLHIYDFDRSTGHLTNHRQISVISDPDIDLLLFTSLEWSPNGRFIYTASSTELHQVDLWEDNIQEDGVRLIDTYNGTQDPFSTTFNFMAQAPDCKIYMCPTSGTRSYHVIHRPDELGTACNFVQNGLKLPQISNFGGMPNFPRFRVDEEEKCDPTLTSVFGDAVYYRRDLQVYPSPSDGRYTVAVPDDVLSGTLTVLDLEGRSILQERVPLGSQTIEIDITSYPSGYYHIELYPDTNRDRVFYGVQVVKM